MANQIFEGTSITVLPAVIEKDRLALGPDYPLPETQVFRLTPAWNEECVGSQSQVMTMAANLARKFDGFFFIGIQKLSLIPVASKGFLQHFFGPDLIFPAKLIEAAA